MSATILEFSEVTKIFGDCISCADISLKVRAGEIHAIVGENGAGKSTSMKMLFGLYPPTTGEIRLRGKTIQFDSPADAKLAGIGMVQQHFMLAPAICGLDHIFLEQRLPHSWWRQALQLLPRKKLLQELQALSATFNMPVPWQTAVGDLTVGIQQRIEILKILYNQADILILDEPTAVLTPQEIESFFAQLRLLKAAGKTILIITHKLNEVLQLADSVSVLRQGRCVFSGEVRSQTPESLSELMVGRKLEKLPAKKPAATNGDIFLQLKNFSYKVLQSVDLQVRAGEVVGIAGVEGNGQSTLLEAILQPTEAAGESSGSLEILSHASLKDGKALLSAAQVRQLPLCYFPEDRLHQGLLLDAGPDANFLLGQLQNSELRKHGWIRWSLVRTFTKEVFTKFDVRPFNLQQSLRRFSGGNQQKFVVGRELFRKPKLILAAQPTRGVDIGAIQQIHRELLQLQDAQCGVLLVSSELEELLQLSDRILVMFKGQIVANLVRAEFDEHRIGALMAGVSSKQGSTTAVQP